MHEAHTRVVCFDREGHERAEIALPSIGSATVHAAHPDSPEVFLGFTSYVTPYEVLAHDVESGASVVWERVATSFAPPPEVVVKTMHATSKDGTRVPMFVIARADALREGARPTCIYGYGGFNQCQTPAFSARTLTFVEKGGVFAYAVLRGGGELGEAWHRAGMLERKQNVFDDFIACAEGLVRAGVSHPDKVAIMGGSNGGLLVAAAITQRPELYRAAMCFVPLTDMLRYHRFRIGKLWIPEYGCADDPVQFAYLYAYSPYHHVMDGVSYPAMMITTAEADSRVDPMHARKLAARLQEASGARPILLRVERKAGHGAGKPLAKVVDDVTEETAFLMRELGML
jgi:prolyl oligopeptidase